MACETIDLRIPALTPAQVVCGGCAERVCAAVRAVPGVQSVECAPGAATLRVCWDTELVSLAEIEEALLASAHSASEGFAHASYRIVGLD